jgi:mitogen-activated protein kinase kinase 3
MMAVKFLIIPQSRFEEDEIHLRCKLILREIENSRALATCSNIVDLYGLCFHGGYALLCMELMNLSLKDLYVIVHKKGEKFPEQLVGCVAVKVIDALIFCKSKNIIHRDIKPSNILVNYSGEIKLCDFGESRIMENSFASSNVGTLAYWPPEHFIRLHRKYDFRSDVWSLGITLMEVILGKLPYLIENNPEINNRDGQFYANEIIITQYITHANLPIIIDEHIGPNYSTMLA